MALINKLRAIANAIRSKTGKTEQLSLDNMVTEIEGIQTGGGGREPIELNLSDRISYSFRESWKEIFENNFISKINVSVVKSDASEKSARYFLSETSTITEEMLPPINMDIWCSSDTILDCSFLFYNNKKIRNYNKVTVTERSFNGFCEFSDIFNSNYYLKEAPIWVKQLAFKHPYSSSGLTSAYYELYYHCYSLDKAILPVAYYATGNLLSNIFYKNFHLGSIKFATEENGTPIDVTWTWRNQSLDLSTTDANIGYLNTDYNTSWDIERFTAAKKVTDLASYEALKDDPDWWSSDVNFSRYNHDSAVETINSLPNVAAKEGNTGNTIKFKGIMGSGYNKAINTLTSEEIAVAAAKGWTVTLV